MMLDLLRVFFAVLIVRANHFYIKGKWYIYSRTANTFFPDWRIQKQPVVAWVCLLEETTACPAGWREDSGMKIVLL